MKEKLLEFLRIPPEVRSVFWQDILQKNRLSLLVICVMIFGMELFNMARVLFLSSVGLGTLNNRIYFGLYFSLWLAAALYLLLSYRTRRAPARKRWAVQYGAVLFFLLWHVVCNAYDLIQGHSAATTIYITAVLALAVFIQMPGLFSIIAYASAYTLFMALTAPVLDEGSKINLTFTTIVSLAVSLTTCRHTVVMTAQRQEIDQINRQLHTLLQRDPLTGLLNTAAFSHCVERCLADAPAEGMATLLIIDLDDFKSVNDQYGHPCGDYVLKETALRLQIPLIAALGTGNKLDPTLLQVTDISKTYGCPLARVMRKELRARGIQHLKVVFSPEEPVSPAQPETPPPGRRSVPASNPWVPATAGLLLGSAVVRDLIAAL